MVDPHPVGFRFRPTDEEIFNPYLKSKNMDGNTSHVDEVISTVDIYSFDPSELASHSSSKATDYVWYYFCRKENKYNRGERQSRKTKSGSWKKTGVTTNIMRKRGDREKIGEKRVFVFQYSKILGGTKLKSDWVMHEYVATFVSPAQTPMVTYTLCKVMFKGDASDLPSSSAAPAGGGGGRGCDGGCDGGGGGCDGGGGGGGCGGGGGSGCGGCDGDGGCDGGGGDGGCGCGGGGCDGCGGGGGEFEHTHSLIIPMNNPGGGMSAEAERSSSELHNPRQFSGFLHLEEETQMEDAIRRAINSLSPHDLNCLLNNDYDDEEQGNTQEDNRGERQSRKTKSGFWKKTGPTMDIFQKRGDREKIGEKRVLVFHSSGSKSKSAWVMHEYVATFLPPTDHMTYTLCKLKFKGDASDLPSSSGADGGGDGGCGDGGGGGGDGDGGGGDGYDGGDGCGGVDGDGGGGGGGGFDGGGGGGGVDEHNQFLITHNSGGYEVGQFNVSTDDFNCFLNYNDDEEQGNTMFMQYDRNTCRPNCP
ncbi:unnamed protein product [Brassica oleracea var. botrytis]